MNKRIFLNLPVADLPKSTAFFKALGYSLNPEFTGDTSSCVVISETITIMLLPHAKFREFTPKAVCDTKKAVEVLISLSCESRQEVDDQVAKALRAGATNYEDPEDFGFMYMRSFVDLDGHGWNLVHLSGSPGGSGSRRRPRASRAAERDQ